jgi:hypothetical protein
MKPFMINSSRRKKSKSGLHFCSRKCKDEAQRIGGIQEISRPITEQVWGRKLTGGSLLTMSLSAEDAVMMNSLQE